MSGVGIFVGRLLPPPVALKIALARGLSLIEGKFARAAEPAPVVGCLNQYEAGCPLADSGDIAAFERCRVALARSPTCSLVELGLIDFDAASRTVLVAPAGTSTDILDKLNAAVPGEIADPSVGGRQAELGAEVEAITAAAPAAILQKQDASIQEIEKARPLKTEWKPPTRLADLGSMDRARTNSGMRASALPSRPGGSAAMASVRPTNRLLRLLVTSSRRMLCAFMRS